MEQQQKRAPQISLCFSFCLLIMLGATLVGTVKGDDLAQKCGQVVQKVIPCLNFATGKTATPSKECCDAATKIKESDPECLCYIIQQTHKGSPESKSLGIQEDKLLQLPSACSLKNASVSNCPKLLGLSPSSPDAAIFTNASSSGTPSAASATESATPQSQKDSYGTTLIPSLITDLMAVAVSIVVVVIPTGVVSIYT